MNRTAAACAAVLLTLLTGARGAAGATPVAPAPAAPKAANAPKLLTLPSLPAPTARPDATAARPNPTCAVGQPGGVRMLEMPAPGADDANRPAAAATGEVPPCRTAKARADDRAAAPAAPPGSRVEARVINGQRVQQLRLAEDVTAKATPAPPSGPVPEIRQLPDGRQMLVLPEVGTAR